MLNCCIFDVLIVKYLYIGEDNYGIFQKTSEDNNCSNSFYFYSLDSGFDDVTTIIKLGDCEKK